MVCKIPQLVICALNLAGSHILTPRRTLEVTSSDAVDCVSDCKHYSTPRSRDSVPSVDSKIRTWSEFAVWDVGGEPGFCHRDHVYLGSQGLKFVHLAKKTSGIKVQTGD